MTQFYAKAAAPQKLNHYPVISSFATPGDRATRAGFVVLVDKQDGEFVTAWAGDGDSSWCWGHYFEDRAEAEADFRARCARGY